MRKNNEVLRKEEKKIRLIKGKFFLCNLNLKPSKQQPVLSQHNNVKVTSFCVANNITLAVSPRKMRGLTATFWLMGEANVSKHFHPIPFS